MAYSTPKPGGRRPSSKLPVRGSGTPPPALTDVLTSAAGYAAVRPDPDPTGQAPEAGRRARDLARGRAAQRRFALEDGADMFKVMDGTRHRRVETLKGYDRRAKAFRDHAGDGFL
jgi:hypothetical protein